MTKRLITIAVPLLLFGCGSKETNQLGGAQQNQEITVDVFEVKSGEVARFIEIPGSILPNEVVELYAESAGRIQSIRFKEGQVVGKGTILVQIDSDVLNAQINKLKVDLDLAEKDENRKKALVQAKGISQEEYEKAASALDNIKAQIAMIRVQIEKNTIRAPFSGRIGLRKVSEGAYITPSTLITTIIQENPIKIEFAIPEKYATHVAIGQTINYHETSRDEMYQAKVYAYEPMINAETRMLTLRAEAPNKGKLIPGSLVAIKYDMGIEENAFMIPAESIIPVLNGQKIYVVRNGKVAEVPVQIGIRTAEQVQITGAIKTGDLVLTSGLLAVRPDMPVKTNLVK